jgi:hypothetical protein
MVITTQRAWVSFNLRQHAPFYGTTKFSCRGSMQNVDTLRISNRTSVFKTPWFELLEKSVENNSAPHYSIRTRDYVSVLAITRDRTFVLVRQFRSAIEMFTLELRAVMWTKNRRRSNRAQRALGRNRFRGGGGDVARHARARYREVGYSIVVFFCAVRFAKSRNQI